MENLNENNSVLVAGRVDSPPVFDHQVYGEKFYKFKLAVPRLSGQVDLLPVTVSERLMCDVKMDEGTEIVVEGQFRSYNKFLEGKSRLILTVFARDLYLKNKGINNPNRIFLNGFICKPPVYRTTPFKREITDILLAVNRPYNKSDYIPCIAWGRNARYSAKFSVGDNIKIWGRVQSRNYQKKLPSGEVTERTAYEVSISRLEVVSI